MNIVSAATEKTLNLALTLTSDASYVVWIHGCQTFHLKKRISAQPAAEGSVRGSRGKWREHTFPVVYFVSRVILATFVFNEYISPKRQIL